MANRLAGTVHGSELGKSPSSEEVDSGRSGATNRQPFVSIIIPVYNDNERLARTLAALEEQTYRNFEVIVVDNASRVKPTEVVRAFSHVELTTETKPGSYCARNQGLSVARGDWLGFTDADCEPSERWIEHGVRALQEHGGRAVVAGYTERHPENPDAPTATELYEIVNLPDPKARAEREGWAITGNMFTHRDVFETVGGFDERHKSWGDKEWGQRASAAGFPVVYCREAHVDTPARRNLRTHLTKSRRLVGGARQLRRRDAELATSVDAGVSSNDAGSRSTNGSYLPWNKVLPPVGEMIRLSSDERLSGPTQKVKVVWVSLLTHYTKGIEHVRLRLGADAERR